MATGVISKKYLIDIANAIRIMLDTETTYTPSQMASAIALITGNASGGELVKSSNTDVGIITDTLIGDICDALRTALDSEDTYTPSQIADAIMTISSGSVDIVPWSTGTDEQIVAMLQAAHNGDIDLQTDGGWAVGDVRTINIGSYTTRWANNNGNWVEEVVPARSVGIVLTSFSDYQSCGALAQFDFADMLLKISLQRYDAQPTSGNVSGGYGMSSLYVDTFPNLVEALPSWLKSSLREFSCTSRAGAWTAETVMVPNNKLAPRSCGELGVTGKDGDAVISYYQNAENRKKGAIYFTRSIYRSSDGAYYIIKTNGGSDWYDANTCYDTRGVIPFGCL